MEPDIRIKLKEIALTDVLNSRRMNDAIREALTSALLKKTDEMSASEILTTIAQIEAIPKTAPYREILDLLDKQ